MNLLEHDFLHMHLAGTFEIVGQLEAVQHLDRLVVEMELPPPALDEGRFLASPLPSPATTSPRPPPSTSRLTPPLGPNA